MKKCIKENIAHGILCMKNKFKSDEKKDEKN